MCQDMYTHISRWLLEKKIMTQKTKMNFGKENHLDFNTCKEDGKIFHSIIGFTYTILIWPYTLHCRSMWNNKSAA